jgi:hypothetical protein
VADAGRAAGRPSPAANVGGVPGEDMILADGTKLLLIHLGCRGPGGWRPACEPGSGPLDGPAAGRLVPQRYSDDPRGVTCPLCRASDGYRRAAAALGGL